MEIAPACPTAREASLHGPEDGDLIVADHQSYVWSSKLFSYSQEHTIDDQFIQLACLTRHQHVSHWKAL